MQQFLALDNHIFCLFSSFSVFLFLISSFLSYNYPILSLLPIFSLFLINHFHRGKINITSTFDLELPVLGVNAVYLLFALFGNLLHSRAMRYWKPFIYRHCVLDTFNLVRLLRCPNRILFVIMVTMIQYFVLCYTNIKILTLIADVSKENHFKGTLFLSFSSSNYLSI